MRWMPFVFCLAVGFSGVSTSARAWECSAQAVGMNPAWGSSKEYKTREEAEARALRECYNKGAKQCRIQYCGRDRGDR